MQISTAHEVNNQVNSAELVTYNFSQKNSANKLNIKASKRQSLGRGLDIKLWCLLVR